MDKKSYHKYVFDEDNKEFVGEFEQMYKDEDIDPWYCSDLRTTSRKIHTAILQDMNWSYILDYGCGKGAFTHTLKKNNNRVIGVDVSKNAINKAVNMYGHLCEFHTLKDDESLGEGYDLIVCLEVLSYLSLYEDQLRKFSNIGKYLYISLYIPTNPIGFVKSIENLITSVDLYFNIEQKIIFNDESVFLLAKSRLLNSMGSK
jgi:2-polyprenyl-3-methyl-5-hydroxy-6-metoxy-1,4-benzoquinol methylase